MKYLIIILAISILMVTCKSKTEIIELPTELIVTVKNQAGNLQPEATVALFEDISTFKAQSSIFSTAGSIKQGTTDVEGKFKFDSLEPGKKYYVAAYITDSIKFKNYNYKIHHDNGFTGFELLRPLNKSAVTNATISLTPAEAIISFYANDFNAQGVPIKIFIEDDSIGTISQVKTNLDSININPSSNPFQNGYITKKVRLTLDPIPLRFINAFECNNINRLNVVAGEFNKVNVNQCNSGVVSFWTIDANASALPISVFINGNNSIGDIKATLKTLPTDFQSANLLNYVLEPGDYTYLATSPGCNWQGKFTITTNKYLPVLLERCE